MTNIQTPLGEVAIEIDGERTDYIAAKGKINDVTFPNILGRYHIIIDFIPDGKKHIISCVIKSSEKLNRTIESGENLECQSFYSKNKIKISIGLLGESWRCVGGKLVECENDYDIEYLDDGMAYCVLEGTKTQKYIFGIAWIDNVGWDDALSYGEHNRGLETWFASDPKLPL